ncbi:HAD family hydrolase [Pseudonocardia kujensis]|uniref:HAD family hydrolase n=1 Tax=Pseudonocardia kujensis TaxID=1128675 RepID=UPI001E5FC597|nr:HAD family hydrolase [Pseudonocardia kujensis]MCE0763884.1 HAD family hydrolase [Pseudonocardia kujensis]
MAPETTVDTAVLDVDGTLVDTNYHHALAWFRAFRRFDVTLPVWRLHRAIGMGGDQLVPAVAGKEFEAEHGDGVREAWKEEFDPLLREVQPFEGVRELLTALRDAGLKIVLASSGKPEHVDAYLDLFGGRELADAWTTSKDVEQTKPQPDLIGVAVEKVEGREALVVGDSVWDFEAAGRAGYAGYAIRTGGFSVDELREAGARDVFESVPELREHLVTALARR